MSELSADAQKKVLELKQAYIDSFANKIQYLETCWQNIQASQFAQDDLEALRTACHKLAGSAGSYEFLQISEAAQKVEQLCLTEIFALDSLASDQIQLPVRAEIESGYRLLVMLLQQAS